MLRELRIENLLLIERAELRLRPGLNVITGETGAGKTVLAHSLDLLMGGKPRKGVVRPGAPEAWVEGVFDLPAGLEGAPELADLAERLPRDAEELVIGRRVSAGGRSSAFVAGRSATVADLKALSTWLLAFYGQHEHRRLTIASAQMEILDGSGGQEQLDLREAHREAHLRRQRAASELAELRAADGARERDLDLLRFELEEIEDAAPTVEEEQSLAVEREQLRHAESLRIAAERAASGLGGDVTTGEGGTRLTEAVAELGGVGGVDGDLDRLTERLTALGIELDDVVSELRGYLDRLEADPGRLSAIEERLEVIDRLTRKHGGSVASVLDHAEHCAAEIRRLEGGESRERELEERLEEAESERQRLATELTGRRKRLAAGLREAVSAELDELAMPGAELTVELPAHPDGHGPHGAETVEMLLATNPGLEPAPLREAASGGELSRVMLALTGLGHGSGGATLVFDEIDAGIGGNTARVVGEKLRRVGDRGQVLAITHLPQVASRAEAHFRVTKKLDGEAALAEVERIEGEELVEEVRRMMGADSGDEAATRHARELVGARA